LQAHPHVYLTAERKSVLEGVDMAEISISSSSTVTVGTPPEGSFTLPGLTDIGVTVELAEGTKCERCWQVLTEVGTGSRADLCLRCDDAVVHL
jgi:isoleucyl-tRNA synthetase